MNRVFAKRARPRRASSPVRLEALEDRQLLASFSVTNVMDSGTGSLRQAILDSDGTPGTNTISFNIPGAGVQTIAPTSPLPEINNPAVVDATTQPGYSGTPLIELNGANIFQPNTTPPAPIPNVSGLVLSGGASTVKGFTIDRFTGAGIATTRDGNTIAANYIGTDTTGTLSLGNGGNGISLGSRNNVVGGTGAASRNLISGNSGFGVQVSSLGNNRIQGNYIGTDVTGTINLGNSRAGVAVFTSSNNTIGGDVPAAGNVIAFNGGAGVQIGSFSFDSSSNQNKIVENSIFSNTGLGIDLGGDGVTFNHPGGANFGPNLLQNYPVLTSAYGATTGTTIEGTLNASPTSPYTINFFSSPTVDPTGFGQGKTFLGSTTVTTDTSGNADVTSTPSVVVPPNQFISATATDAAGNTSEFARSIAVTAAAQSDLVLQALNPNPTPQAGIAQAYTYLVRNNGPSRATNVVVTDVLPAGATFLSGTSTQGAVVASNGTVTITLGTLASGATAQYTLNYSIATPGPVVNTVSVRADQPDPHPSDNTLTQNFVVSSAPPIDLALSGSASPFPIRVGDSLTYTFVVSNQDSFNPGTGVVLTDNLPQGVSYVSAVSSQGSATFVNGVVTASLGKINAGFNAVVTIVVKPTAAGPLTNTASVIGNEADPNSVNNQASVSSFVNLAPTTNLALLGSANPPTVHVGDSLTYTFVVRNLEFSNPGTGVVFTDLLPQGVTYVSASSSQGTASFVNGIVTASLGTVIAGSNVVVTIIVTPTATGTLTNSASVMGNEPDQDALNNLASVTTIVNPAPTTNLALFGFASPFSVQVGDSLTYTFVVHNLEFSNPGTNVVFTDQLPQGVTYVSSQSSQGITAFVNGTVSASLGTVNAGSNAVVTIVVKPTATGPLTNTASVRGTESDPDSLNNQASVTTLVNPAPATDLAVIVTAAPQSPSVGNSYTYAVLVGNPGAATATGVSLVDILPDAAAIVSIRPSQGTYTLVGRTLTVDLGSIAPGALTQVTINLIPGAPGLLLTQAAVSGDQPDPNIANNYSSFSAIVQADVTAPTVTYSKLKIAHNTISSIVLTFDKDLDAALANDPANYQILDLGGNGSSTASGPKVPVALAVYDPIARSVTVTPSRGLSIGRFYKLVVNGQGATGVTDKSGNVLDGASNGLQNSIYTAIIGRGTKNRPVSVQTNVPSPNASATHPTSKAKAVKVSKAQAVPVQASAAQVRASAVPIPTDPVTVKSASKKKA